jgi:hypothetical protein
MKYEVTRMDRIRNENVFEKMRSYRLAWYGHIMRRDETHITKRVMSMNR